MTNGSNDLETIKEILFTVARRYEAAAERMDATDERLERLSQGSDEQIERIAKGTDERLERLAQGSDERLERLGQRIDEQIERLGQKQERTQEQLDRLREDVDITFQTISLMIENGDREMAEFRSAILGLQTENHRIWEYLMRRYRNGNSDQP